MLFTLTVTETRLLSPLVMSRGVSCFSVTCNILFWSSSWLVGHLVKARPVQQSLKTSLLHQAAFFQQKRSLIPSCQSESKKRIVKIVEECYLVTWVDKVCKMLSEHFVRSQAHKLLDVVTGKDNLPAGPNHKAEAVEIGEKIGTGKVIVFLIKLNWVPLQPWVWSIGKNSIL